MENNETLQAEFLANMSHKIRTHMNSIIGFAELALDEELSPKAKHYLANIMKNSEFLLQIMSDTRDISELSSGTLKLENRPFSLVDIFNECRLIVMPKVLEKNLTLHFYAEPSFGKKICGDPVRIRQICVNLLTNAIKFSDKGIVKMQAATKEIGENSVTIFFDVKDSGIGIEKDHIKNIFDPFTQADDDVIRNFGGFGLGLPITKSLIELMGGKINVESKPGSGSRFFFELTFDAIDTEDDYTENSNSNSNQTGFEEIKKPVFNGEVLLCEDSSMNQIVICEHLERVGLRTVVAENGKVGVEKIRDRLRKGEPQFDLILMDIYMPVMDGLEAAEKIHRFKTGVPIVAMTANIMKNDRDLYISLGMSDCISKPFTSQELWRCLLKYINPVE